MKEEIIYKGIVYKYTGIRYYYISEDGEVISMRTSKPYIMKAEISRDGYKRVPLKYEKGKERKYFVHRLVYKVFIGELIEGLVIDHIDGNRTNNNYLNLRQCSQKKNIENALAHNFGNNNARKVKIKVKATGEILEFNKVKDLIEYTGIPITNGNINALIQHYDFIDNYILLEYRGKEVIDNEICRD